MLNVHFVLPLKTSPMAGSYADLFLKTKPRRAGNLMFSAARLGPSAYQTLGMSSLPANHPANTHCNRSDTFESSVGHPVVSKYLRVQVLVSKTSIKNLNHRILDGFPRPNEIELHFVLVGLGIERLGGKFAPIAHGDYLRVASLFCYALDGHHHLRPRERKIRFD
jgi:hypothetical protein